LLELYRKYYPSTHAIKLILEYLKFDNDFKKLPTVREMQLLLALYQQPSREKAAKFLNIPYNVLFLHIRDIEENKLVKHNLSEVLTKIRKTLADICEYKHA
jgi:hypothetical protein